MNIIFDDLFPLGPRTRGWLASGWDGGSPCVQLCVASNEFGPTGTAYTLRVTPDACRRMLDAGQRVVEGYASCVRFEPSNDSEGLIALGTDHDSVMLTIAACAPNVTGIQELILPLESWAIIAAVGHRALAALDAAGPPMEPPLAMQQHRALMKLSGTPSAVDDEPRH